MDHPNHKVWLGEPEARRFDGRRRARVIEEFSRLGLSVQELGREEAEQAWLKLVGKVAAATGVDLGRSRDRFLWEALAQERQERPISLPRTSEHWIVLAEGYRDFALRLDHADIAIKDLPRTIPDLVIIPAPRIRWLLSLPHENYIDPLYVNLKGTNGNETCLSREF